MSSKSEQTKTKNNEIKDKVTAPVTNPVASNSLPASEKNKRKSVTSNLKPKTRVKTPEHVINPMPVDEDKIAINRQIVAKINSVNPVKTVNKMYGGYLTNTLSSANKAIDYISVIRDLNTYLQGKNTLNDLYNIYNAVLGEKLHCGFVAFGVFHEKSKCINLRLTNSTGSTYSSKIFLSEIDNPIIQAFKSASAVINKDNKFLNIPYLKANTSIVLPLISLNQTIGVLILGGTNENYNLSILSYISNYAAMYMQNIDLKEKTNKYANADNLTNLYNHRGFQEVLAVELQKAKETETPLSIVMFDIV